MERLTKHCDDFIVMKSSLGYYVESFDTSASDIRLLLEKLAQYEDLEEQGKLLKLPCAVGDTVYRVHKGTELSPTRIYECRVTAVKQEYNTISVKLYSNINEETYSIWVDNWFDKCQIGYEFFLTENEALQKMNEMEWKE